MEDLSGGKNSDPEILSSARAQLSKMPLMTIDGVPYSTFHMPDLPGTMELIRNLELRLSDVINIGFPRSGNHWMFEIVEMLMRNSVEYAKETFIDRILENQHNGVAKKREDLASMTGPRILTTHCRVSKLSNQIAEKKVKVIYILRNPKDAICSWYNLFSSYIDSVRFPGSWEEFFEVSLTGEIPWGSWFDHVIDVEIFTKDHPSVPVFIAQYEKFRADPETEIRKLAGFLGQPEDKVSDIAKAVEIEAMKVGTAVKIAALEKYILDKSSEGIIVKGLVGEWKKHFTVDMNERYNREFETRMKGSWIADMMREYL